MQFLRYKKSGDKFLKSLMLSDGSSDLINLKNKNVGL